LPGGGGVIRLHRLNGNETVVNAELIESVESLGQETVLALTTGNKIVVKEAVTEVVQLAIEYKKMVYAKAQERSFPCPSPS
jgi:uncharacterized protein YlzI (FlbEa/FlbD family)